MYPEQKQPTSASHLWIMLLDFWNQPAKQYLMSLGESLPARGWYFDESKIWSTLLFIKHTSKDTEGLVFCQNNTENLENLCVQKRLTSSVHTTTILRDGKKFIQCRIKGCSRMHCKFGNVKTLLEVHFAWIVLCPFALQFSGCKC